MTAFANSAARLVRGTRPPGAGHLTKWFPTFFVIGAFWMLVINQQRLEWTVNPVYSYGWAVPLLAGYLFWSRWVDRPSAGAGVGLRWFLCGVVLLLAAYLPVRAIQEANPDWVKINWLMALLWIGLTWLTLLKVGGTAYARHFVFPLLFCFTALPWPVWMEEALSQNLMRWNAAVSAEMLTLMGTPALAQGNMIQVGEHWVNVAEACSGIRSLQTAFMGALFLGEFYRMNLGRRGFLLLASIAAAFFVNLARTVLLSGLAKPEEIEKWHDVVGTVTMVVCLLSLWWLAEIIKSAAPKSPGAKSDPGGSTRGLFAPFNWPGAVTVGLWLLAVEGIVWGWYHVHERNLPPPMVWNLHWPRQSPAFAEGRFEERMSALLKFNEGATASWDTPDGHFLQMYYLRWQPGRVSKFLSSAHYPTVCLPATGLSIVSETGVWHCPVGGVDIPFTTYVFDEGGRDVYVFHAVVEDRPDRGGTRLSYRQVSSSERIDSVLRGERNLGQRALGIAVRGPFSPSEARAAVAGTLASVVSINQTVAGSIVAFTP